MKIYSLTIAQLSFNRSLTYFPTVSGLINEIVDPKQRLKAIDRKDLLYNRTQQFAHTLHLVLSFPQPRPSHRPGRPGCVSQPSVPPYPTPAASEWGMDAHLGLESKYPGGAGSRLSSVGIRHIRPRQGAYYMKLVLFKRIGRREAPCLAREPGQMHSPVAGVRLAIHPAEVLTEQYLYNFGDHHSEVRLGIRSIKNDFVRRN